jgi:hypothetical protein
MLRAGHQAACASRQQQGQTVARSRVLCLLQLAGPAAAAAASEAASRFDGCFVGAACTEAQLPHAHRQLLLVCVETIADATRLKRVKLLLRRQLLSSAAPALPATSARTAH